jgi:site-specific DNA-methyltransferase (adenine-specific)
MNPYYSDELVTLYHGDCREITEWLDADVLVTDPPYGIGWKQRQTPGALGDMKHDGIANDSDTTVRDVALALWGKRPALVFGSLRAPFPVGWLRMLVFKKPTIATGITGHRIPWMNNWEPIFVCGSGWPDALPTRDAVIRTQALTASGYSGYATRAGHPHAKPLDVIESLLTGCPPGVVADPFAGSGSTLVAAKAVGRKAIGVELDERYCEVIAKRLAQDVLTFGESA